MINFEKFTLENGLKVIVHQDKSTPIVAFNLLYDVGARDENENQTGFAHLFEHLMFGGSVNIANFDEPLQKVGGTNNAFTSNDITNYYITLPKDNLETAFWLDSDRMLSLAFTDKSLEVQRSVVIEEFKQNYLNQPYGDVWLLLRPLAYTTHPYKWATIGKEISHIENATMEDVKAFFHKHYLPNNAILTVAGDVESKDIKTLAEQWFGDIPSGKKTERNLQALTVRQFDPTTIGKIQSQLAQLTQRLGPQQGARHSQKASAIPPTSSTAPVTPSQTTAPSSESQQLNSLLRNLNTQRD